MPKRFPSRTVLYTVVVHKHLQPVRSLVSYNVGSSNEPGTSLKRTVGALVVRSHCMDDQFTGARTLQAWSSELGVFDGEQGEWVLWMLVMMQREPYHSCLYTRSAFWLVLPQKPLYSE